MPAERAALLVLAVAVLAGGCQARKAEAPAARETVAPAPEATPIGPSTARDPQAVLIAWAQAVSLRDWLLARAYWGEHGTQSGLELDEFAARWGRLKDPVVDLGKGREEGAAGSLFYTAPVTIHDGKRTIAGQVVLRRANDVPGASAEDLRWHIVSTTLEP